MDLINISTMHEEHSVLMSVFNFQWLFRVQLRFRSKTSGLSLSSHLLGYLMINIHITFCLVVKSLPYKTNQ